MANSRNTRSSRRARPTRRTVLLAQTWWEDRVLRGVADYAAKHDWELDCRMHWTHELPTAKEWRGDGIIAFAGVSRDLQPATRRLISFVRGAGVPVVETQPLANYFNAPKVVVPHEDVGRVAAEYFLGLNFRELGFVTFDENPLEESRRASFRRAVVAAGATFHALQRRTLRRAFARLPKPMALFAVNDPNALEVVRLCRDAGYRVPEELAVLGVDDTEIICDLAAVPLSSINCNFERQGYEAAALLDRLMRGDPEPKSPILIPPRGVTVRRSTDTIAIPDLGAAQVLRQLRDRFREPLTIEELTRGAGIRRRQVSERFRAHVGHSLLQELTRLRVAHAQTLLVESKGKLERIAVESGFSSRFHFVRAFRRVTGQTPKTWRRQRQVSNGK